MPKIIKRLPDTKFRTAPIKEKNYVLRDGDGLRLLVRKSGTKTWQYLYLFSGKEKTYTIGEYPLISAVEAREKRDALKKMVGNDIDPGDHKKSEKLKREYEHKNSFEALAREWHRNQPWVEKHSSNVLRTLEKDIFKHFGKKPISQVTRLDILNALQKIEARGSLDVAKRMNQYCHAVFEYALLNRLCTDNPAIGLSKRIKSHVVQHRPYLKEDELPAFLEKVDHYHGSEIVKLALKLLMLTFVRPGELRRARWNEIDEKKARWIIPQERMKMKRTHIVPLSPQALEVIAQIRKISGKSPILFPGRKNFITPITDVTMLRAIKLMGYQDKVVPHGFRATASTILNENSFRADVIERQLAHFHKNKVRASYNHAEYLPERMEMMDWWGNYLEEKYQGVAIMPRYDKKNNQKKAA